MDYEIITADVARLWTFPKEGDKDYVRFVLDVIESKIIKAAKLKYEFISVDLRNFNVEEQNQIEKILQEHKYETKFVNDNDEEFGEDANKLIVRWPKK